MILNLFLKLEKLKLIEILYLIQKYVNNVPLKYAGDCGSQICWTGLLESQVKKGVSLKDTFVTQSWRLDSVVVNY